MLWYNLWKTPADELFEVAMEDYRGESYSQAIDKFDRFLNNYPNHEKASEARVRIVLAKLRLVLVDHFPSVIYDPENSHRRSVTRPVTGVKRLTREPDKPTCHGLGRRVPLIDLGCGAGQARAKLPCRLSWVLGCKEVSSFFVHHPRPGAGVVEFSWNAVPHRWRAAHSAAA